MRRGQVGEMFPWITRLGLMIVAVVVIALLVRYYANRDVQEAEITKQALLYRLYYDDIVMYADPATKRVYPGIVALNQVNNERLAKFFPAQPGKVPTLAACLRLLEGDKEISKACTNEQAFNNFISQARADWQGPGGATYETQTWPVSIKDANSERPGFLEVTIVRSNT
jgi:hypothetical protein